MPERLVKAAAEPVMPPGEVKRKLEHIAPIAFCLLLRDLAYPWIMALSVAALVYGALGSRFLAPGTMREHEAQKGYAAAKIYYALSIFILLIIFHSQLVVVAAAWSYLAIGDAFSNLAGRRFGTHKVKWNPRLSWEGAAAFVLTSFPVAWFMILWVSGREGASPITVGTAAAISLLGAIVGALIELLPRKLDDNLTIPFGTAGVVWLLSTLRGVW